jgi:hypothetical protein
VRNEWKFFSALPKADRWLTFLWWAAILLRGLLPAVFAITMGWLVDSFCYRLFLRSTARLVPILAIEQRPGCMID